MGGGSLGCEHDVVVASIVVVEGHRYRRRSAWNSDRHFFALAPYPRRPFITVALVEQHGVGVPTRKTGVPPFGGKWTRLKWKNILSHCWLVDGQAERPGGWSRARRQVGRVPRRRRRAVRSRSRRGPGSRRAWVRYCPSLNAPSDALMGTSLMQAWRTFMSPFPRTLVLVAEARNQSPVSVRYS